MHPFHKLIATFSEDNHTRGKQFERLCKWILETDPVYASKLTKVWLWDDWPDRWGPDCGIDLVGRDTEGKIWAIQAKCYDPDYAVTKKDIDSFLSESSNDQIDTRLLIATTDKVGPNAVNVIHRANSLRPVNQLLLTELLEKPFDWPASLDDLSSAGIKEPFKPKPHQQTAIEDVVTGFEEHDRGQLIMACGTGKTLAALWIAEELKSQTTLVLLPSLLLLSKTLAEWLRHSKEPFSFLPVCSDESVSKSSDIIRFTTSDLSFPSTTSELEIAEFLKRDGEKVIFSTYQSSPQIAAAYKNADLRPLDLVIADEAHRCAGKAGTDHTTVLDKKEIPAAKRLFMTATPKVFRTHIKKAAEELGVEVNSMDDVELFGPVFHKLSFGAAIANVPPLLTDYRVVVVGVDDALYAEMISKKEFIHTENEIETDAQSFASHIGLAKAIKDYDLRRVITFHSRVKSANDFQKDFPKVVSWMPEDSRPSGDLITNYVSGAMSTSQRNQNLRRLGELEEGERAILSNARCLSEGVDVPALDGVAFIDPRSSEIDIVQAVGRAIRLSSEKTRGTIMIPVFIKEHEDPDEVLSSSVFKKVWAVVNALRSHDEQLGIELDNLRRELGKTGIAGRPGKIYFDLPTRISVEFEEALSVRLIKSTTTSWEFWFGLLEQYKEEHGNCGLKKKYVTEGGYKLGYWAVQQGVRFRKGKLRLDRISQLENLGFNFGRSQDLTDKEYWKRGIRELILYKKQHGNCDVFKSYVTEDGFKLGAWAGNQGVRFRKGKLSLDRISQLENLGFDFGRSQAQAEEEKWEGGIRELILYKKQHGNIDIRYTYSTPSGFNLGAWLVTRRMMKRNGQLHSEKILQLENLGVQWGTKRESFFERGVGELVLFNNQYGHCNVAQSYVSPSGYLLGSWVNKRRRNKEKLSPDKIKQLDELGFDWGKKRYGTWLENYAILVAYVKDKGDCDVPNNYETPDGFALGRWHQRQRQRPERLTVQQRSDLERLGFDFRKRTDLISSQWAKGLAELETYKEQNGNCSVNGRFVSSSGHKLGSWVAMQRTLYAKGRLNPQRVQKLNQVGFVWAGDNSSTRWLTGYAELETYKEQHGNCAIVSSYISPSGYRLGQWVSMQRVSHRKGSLTTEKVEKLNEIGFIWKVRK